MTDVPEWIKNPSASPPILRDGAVYSIADYPSLMEALNIPDLRLTWRLPAGAVVVTKSEGKTGE